MAITIPSNFSATNTEFSLRSSATQHNPTLGGPSQRIARMGDRWSVKFDVAPMRTRDAEPLISVLLAGLSEKVIVEVRQSGVDLSAYGNGTVTGAASGRSLNHSGGGPTKFVGQFFSVVKNGVRYLHRITAVTGATLAFLPMLKVALTGGETIEFGSPKVEGFIDGNSQAWTVGRIANAGLSFTLIEAQ